MEIALRAGSDGDFESVARLDGISFGITYDADDLAEAHAELDLSRFVLADTEGQLVGAAGAYPLSMTVPGGRSLDVPGVTWVSVAPTHRRRGVLRAMMHRQLREYASAGVALAALTASEGGIYRRFGYGPATVQQRWVVSRPTATLRSRVDTGDVRYVDAPQTSSLLPRLHDQWCRHMPGAVGRSPSLWAARLADRPGRRGGASALQYLVHPGGYLAYRSRHAGEPGRMANTATITDYAVSTPAARAALWQVLLQLDLFDEINSVVIPVDDPLPHLLDDARQVRTAEPRDGLWVRLLDVAAALSARTYGVDVDVVLEVHDELLGTGRYRLRGDLDGADCTPTDALPDVRCDTATLASLYLGGHRLQVLREAGLVEADDGRLASRLDRALVAERAPAHGTDF